MNLLKVNIISQGTDLIADAESFQVTLPPAQAERARNHVGKTCTFGIRPEDIYDKRLANQVAATSGNTITVDVDVTEPLGSHIEMHLKCGDVSLIAMIDSKSQTEIGDSIEVILDMNNSHLFDTQTEQALY